jgi:hypothetical protein
LLTSSPHTVTSAERERPKYVRGEEKRERRRKAKREEGDERRSSRWCGWRSVPRLGFKATVVLPSVPRLGFKPGVMLPRLGRRRRGGADWGEGDEAARVGGGGRRQPIGHPPCHRRLDGLHQPPSLEDRRIRRQCLPLLEAPPHQLEEAEERREEERREALPPNRRGCTHLVATTPSMAAMAASTRGGG